MRDRLTVQSTRTTTKRRDRQDTELGMGRGKGKAVGAESLVWLSPQWHTSRVGVGEEDSVSLAGQWAQEAMTSHRSPGQTSE
jgi:hypothetical protein